MDLDGHYLITKAAMALTRGKLSFFPAATDLAAVNRDLEDLTGAHDSDEGQRHHFMAIKGQSAEAAYQAGLAWIKSYATEAARMYGGGLKEQFKQNICAGAMNSLPGQAVNSVRSIAAAGSAVVKGQRTVPLEFPQRSSEFGTMLCSGAYPLGTAVHAVEDSFAPMHVVRAGGKITQIRVYADDKDLKDEHGHSEHDKADRAWEGNKSGFSDIGLSAVAAVVDLFYLVDAAVRSGQPTLTGWQSYVNKWFQADFKGKTTPLLGVVPPTAPVVPKPSQLTNAGPRHHTVSSGESLSIISGKYYADVLLWPVIFDANRQTVRDPNMIQPGWLLNIPYASTIPADQKPALRERGLHWRSGL